MRTIGPFYKNRIMFLTENKKKILAIRQYRISSFNSYSENQNIS